MEHGNLAIVLILTFGLALAGILGYLARYLKLPAILGYLLAGFIIGPYSPGYVADLVISEQLAEIGVILMLFGVGLHFKLEDLMSVKSIAIPGATGQTLAATALTTIILYALGWKLDASIIMGLSVGVASTVVLVRVLTDYHLLNTKEGHIAIGWLVVEDIFTVIILILLPSLALFSAGSELSLMMIAQTVVVVLIKFVILALFMFTWGHKVIEYILTNVARLRSQELFTLTVLSLMFVIATGSAEVFGTSIALGAFIAGMVIGKTSVRHQAAANALPFKDIFAVIFFLSVGMLFNPMVIITHPGSFLGILFVVLIVKPVSAYVIAKIMKYPFRVAFTVAVSLAQIGEFSFILAEEAMTLKLLPDVGFDLLVAISLFTIAINPLLFMIIDKIDNPLKKMGLSKTDQLTAKKMKKVKGAFKLKVLIVGLGPIGRKIATQSKDLGYKPIIIEHNIDTVADLEEDYEILFGDATEEMILEKAHVEEVAFMFITLPETLKTLSIIDAARRVNPEIQIVCRVNYINEKIQFQGLKVHLICTESEALKEFSELVPKLLKGSIYQPFANPS